MLLGFRAKAIRKYMHAEKMTLQQSAGTEELRNATNTHSDWMPQAELSPWVTHSITQAR